MKKVNPEIKKIYYKIKTIRDSCEEIAQEMSCMKNSSNSSSLQYYFNTIVNDIDCITYRLKNKELNDE